MFIKEACVESGRLVLVLHKGVSGLKYEEDVLLRRNLDASVIKVCDVNNICHGRDLAKLHKKREHALVLYYHLKNSNAAYVGRFRAASQETGGYHVIPDAQYA